MNNKKITIEEENRRLKEMCKKYLSWLNVKEVDLNKALKSDLNNPEMWGPTASEQLSKKD